MEWQNANKLSALMHFHIEQHLNGWIIGSPCTLEFEQFVALHKDIIKDQQIPFRAKLSVYSKTLNFADRDRLFCDMIIADRLRSSSIMSLMECLALFHTAEYQSSHIAKRLRPSIGRYVFGHLPPISQSAVVHELNIHAR